MLHLQAYSSARYLRSSIQSLESEDLLFEKINVIKLHTYTNITNAGFLPILVQNQTLARKDNESTLETSINRFNSDFLIKVCKLYYICLKINKIVKH